MRRLMLLIITLGSLGFSQAAAQEPSDPTGQIAYVYLSKQGHVICTMTLDTGDEKCVPHTVDTDQSDPIWSPNGTLLAYQVHFDDQPPETHLYDVNLNTDTILPTSWFIYSWSPDGSQFLATDFHDERGFGEIVTIQLASNQITQLTQNEVADMRPVWSPDGQQIAYLSGYPDADLMVMNADGSNPKQLTEGLKISLEVQPHWSPDGTQIAFVSSVEGRFEASEIYLINTDGSNLRQLTTLGDTTFDPRWSPDGKRLVFWGFSDDAYDEAGTFTGADIFVINTDGSELTNLTDHLGLNAQPVWSPDGEWIAFTSSRIWENENGRGRSGIFIMRPDGSDLQMLTNEPPIIEGGSSFTNPVWRPE